ncbi:Peptidoglycan-N-acetylmuramic acid deacetylase PdaC [compost metagenome]
MDRLKVLDHFPTQDKVIAFTFDDGPNPLYTRQLIEIFSKVNGKATFFMLGDQIDAHEDVTQEVLDAGHEIGNHTYTHPDLTTLTLQDAQSEILRMEERITGLTGKKPLTFRPPYFGINKDILQFVTDRGYYTIGAVNGEARDWEQPGTEFIVEQTRKTVDKGKVLIFHDGYGDRSQSVEAVRLLLDELQAEGYRFVTVSELIEIYNKQ